MEGVAVHWFSIVRILNPHLSWKDCKTELLQRFGGVTNLSPCEQLAAPRQQGNVNDYIDHFEIIASMVPKETEALYLVIL